MAVADRQKLITKILSEVLKEESRDVKFPWFVNRHQREHFKESFPIIDKIYSDLNGNDSLKGTKSLQCDAYFGGKYNFLFEFDEFQHFSSARLLALNRYPENLKLNYSISDWITLCSLHASKADKYRLNKTTKDFNFLGGRTCQRAYLDCFRDFLPQHNELNPTLRISEFEVNDIYNINSDSIEKVKKLLKTKLKFI